MIGKGADLLQIDVKLCDQINKAIETMPGDHKARTCLLAITESFEDPGSIQT